MTEHPPTVDVMKLIYERAQKAQATIGLPDADDERIAQAVKILEEDHLAKPVLLRPGFFEDLQPEDQTRLIRSLMEGRTARQKPITEEAARALIVGDTKYLAAAMVRAHMLDGYVAGNISTTESTMRPALQVMGTGEGREGYASSFFIMLFPDGRPIFFADCAFNHDPTSEELAKIAIDTAKNVRDLDMEPRIAFLSSSTAGSGKHPHVDKVRAAIEIARSEAPDLRISEQELQLDAALNPEVAERKVRGSAVAGNANVLIFPDLDSGNIAYKMANYLGARAVGPIMQGLNAPANDLSRGCSVQDIVDVVAVTAMQAGALKKKD